MGALIPIMQPWTNLDHWVQILGQEYWSIPSIRGQFQAQCWYQRDWWVPVPDKFLTIHESGREVGSRQHRCSEWWALGSGVHEDSPWHLESHSLHASAATHLHHPLQWESFTHHEGTSSGWSRAIEESHVRTQSRSRESAQESQLRAEYVAAESRAP